MIEMAKVLIDILNGQDVYVAEELEGLYLRFRHYFKDGMLYIEDDSTMIEQLVEYMTSTDLLNTSEPHTFKVIHSLYLKNLLTLYEVSNWHEKFLDIDILAEVEKMEASTMKYIQFEVLKTKVDKHFYRLVSILLAEAQDEYELEEAFFDYTDFNNVLDHESFIKYAVSLTLFNKLEYQVERSLALHEVMLEVLLELARLFEKSLSKNNEVLKELISYADSIADTVYDEVYRN